jgi:hypothetical protein
MFDDFRTSNTIKKEIDTINNIGKSIKLSKDINYPLNKEKLTKWASHHSTCDPDIKLFVETIRDTTVHVSWGEFYAAFKANVDKFMETVNNHPEKLPWMIIDGGDKGKSNHWLVLLMIDYLENEYKQKYGSYIKPERIANDMSDLYGKYIVVYLDDASYSGTQMAANVAVKFKNASPAYILIPYVTNIAIETISNYCNDVTMDKTMYFYKREFHIFYQHKMPTMLENLETYKNVKLSNDEIKQLNFKINDHFNVPGKDVFYSILTSVPWYFDHKIADYKSSFPTIYASGKLGKCKDQSAPEYEVFIDNCEKVDEEKALFGSKLDDKCAPPFYKGLGGGSKHANSIGVDITPLLLKAGAIVKNQYALYNKRKYIVKKDGKKNYIMSKGNKVYLSQIKNKYILF